MATNTEVLPQALWDSHRVSEHLGVPIATLDQWASRRIGPKFAKVGKHRRYRPEVVEAWLDAQTRGGDAA